jgi:hypothetical protein
MDMARRHHPTRALAPRRRRHWLPLVCALLSSFGCGSGAVMHAEAPDPQGRLLTAPSRAARLVDTSEVLRAEVEVFGLQIGTLESSLCPATAQALGTMETSVKSAPIVSVVRRTSGEAKTELSELSPRASEYNFRDGDLLRHYRVEYGAGNYQYAYDNGGPQTLTGTNEVPEGASPHDLHSAMLLLRAWRPRLDEAAYFYVVLGRKLWRVDVRAVGPQVIKAQGSPRLTHRVDGVAVRLQQSPEVAPRRFSVWLSEDADRVPVRMVADASFGELTMTLTDRDVDNGSCAPRAVAHGGTAPAPTLEVAGLIGAAWQSPAIPPGSESSPAR